MSKTLGEINVDLLLRSASFKQALKDAVSESKSGGQQIGEGLSAGSRRAREAAELLNETLGVRLPRALRNVLAHSQLIGPALSAAFNATVYAAFAKEAIDLGQHTIPELVESFTHWKENAERTMKVQSELNKTVQQANTQIAQLQEQYRLIGLEGLTLVGEKTTIAAEKFNAAKEEVAKLTDQLATLQRQSQETTKTDVFIPGVGRQVNVAPTAAAAAAKSQIEGVSAELAKAQVEAQKAGQELENAGKTAQVAWSQDTANRIKAVRDKIDGFTQALRDQIFEQTHNVIAINEYKAAAMAATAADQDAIKALSLKVYFLKQQQDGLKAPLLPHDQFGRSLANLTIPKPPDFQPMATAIAEAAKGAADLANNLSKAGKAAPVKPLTDMQKIGQQAAVDTSQMLANWIVYGGSFKQVLAGIIADFAQMIAQLFIMKAIKSIFSFIPGFAEGGFVPGRATGGPVFGGPYMVGEKGPELFMPATSGFIIPNNKLPDLGAGFGGGVTIVNNIDNRGADLGTTAKTASLLDKFSIEQYHRMVIDRQRRVA